jgi:hypothetical protein
MIGVNNVTGLKLKEFTYLAVDVCLHLRYMLILRPCFEVSELILRAVIILFKCRVDKIKEHMITS